MEISDRGADFLSSTASPTVLVWVLDALSEADLHPDERKQLTFLRAYRECIQERDDFSNFSNDELCILWRAFDRLHFWIDKRFWSFWKAQPVLCWHPDAMVPCHSATPVQFLFVAQLGRASTGFSQYETLSWLYGDCKVPGETLDGGRRTAFESPRLDRKTCRFGDWIIRDDHAIGGKQLKIESTMVGNSPEIVAGCN